MQKAKEKKDKGQNTKHARLSQTASMYDSVSGVDVSIRFRHLEANRTTPDMRFTEIHYPVSVYLGEAVGTHKGDAVVSFTVEAKTNPTVAEFTIKGEAYVKGSPEEIESWVIPNGGKAPNIWIRIYQEAVAMLTILARFIDIPPPSAPTSVEEENE